MWVESGVYKSKEQDQEHFKEMDRKDLLEKLDKKELPEGLERNKLLEELNRKGTHPFGVDRGAYQSKEKDQEHFKELDRKELLEEPTKARRRIRSTSKSWTERSY